MPPRNWQTVRWSGGRKGLLSLVDQTRLPGELQEITCPSVESVWDAIKQLRVRGAPAIGITAAYGVVVGLQPFVDQNETSFFERLTIVCDYLASSRPTAVNLFWAIDRMKRRAGDLRGKKSLVSIHEALLSEAQAIHDEDRSMCHAIGRNGAELLTDGMSVLTHCNAGGLATAEYGTALAVIFTAHEQGRRLHVFVDETRPLLQGARLTAWELMEQGIPCTLICDSMAAQVMREGRVKAVITGADRIAGNGDTANKIGTYGLAVLARAHNIPFYVAAPSSTFDRTIASGDHIVIEQRAATEISHWSGQAIAPAGISIYNPAFDVTPAGLISAIVTEKGIVSPVTAETVRSLLN